MTTDSVCCAAAKAGASATSTAAGTLLMARRLPGNPGAGNELRFVGLAVQLVQTPAVALRRPALERGGRLGAEPPQVDAPLALGAAGGRLLVEIARLLGGAALLAERPDLHLPFELADA